MSLLNAWIMPADAIVAVDTDGARDDGSRFATSKLLAIPHIRAVMALRGQLAVLGYLFLRCISGAFDSLDEMIDAMPLLLADAEENVPSDLIVRTRIGNEIAVVGWSERHRKMIGKVFFKRDDMQEFSAADIETFFVSPWNTSMPDIPRTSAAVEKISRAQVRWMRETFPNAACGGALIAAHLTRKSVTLSHRANL